jgi:hypothetical protein
MFHAGVSDFGISCFGFAAWFMASITRNTKTSTSASLGQADQQHAVGQSPCGDRTNHETRDRGPNAPAHLRPPFIGA